MSIEWDSLILGGGNELNTVGPTTENARRAFPSLGGDLPPQMVTGLPLLGTFGKPGNARER